MAMTAPKEDCSVLFEKTKSLEWYVEFYNQTPEPSEQERRLVSVAAAEIRQVSSSSDGITAILLMETEGWSCLHFTMNSS